MLSDLKIKAVKPTDKPFKIFDGEGLFLLVSPAGGKLWRLKYRFEGKERQLSFGAYPEVSLSDARDRRFEARKLLANGVDPAGLQRAMKTAAAGQDSFEAVYRKFHTRKKFDWSEKHAARLLSRMEADVFPAIGRRPVDSLGSPDLLAVLRPVEARSLETAHRIKIAMGQMYRYAIAEGFCKYDPSSGLKGALTAQKKKHFPTLLEPAAVGNLLRHLDNYSGSVVVRSALQLLPLLFVRPGELRQATWAEFDFEDALWHVPAERMKMKRPHIVPLSRQALEVLRYLKTVTGHGQHLFPGGRNPRICLSDVAFNAALRSMGFDKTQIVSHGFRAMARTLLDEVLQVRVEYIEHQLAHAVKDPLGRAYNRTTHLPERRQMMQQWADYLDTLKSPSANLQTAGLQGR